MFPGEILRTTALVQIDPDLPLGLTIDGGIVKITIQAKTGPLPSPQLLIFDHRLGVINSAEALLGLSADEHAFPSERRSRSNLQPRRPSTGSLPATTAPLIHSPK